ncbi:MAG: ATP-binding cassette domain-containing protein [Acidimicrobiia bacterium]
MVGANGAGKTTFLRILLGLVHPTSGRVSVLGHDAIADPLAVRAKVGYMPENNCLPKDQTAADLRRLYRRNGRTAHRRRPAPRL